MKRFPGFNLILISLIVSNLLIGCDDIEPCDTPILTDIDGNSYKTVNIGTQLWMAENLKVTHYQNGDEIPNLTSGSAWIKSKTGAYCGFNNDSITYQTYGNLYNWFAVNDPRNICPECWHVPDDSEWRILVDYLGGNNIAGGKLKETGTEHWLNNGHATNESGFTGLPGGYRSFAYAQFNSIGIYSYWWTKTEGDSVQASFWGLYWYGSNMRHEITRKQSGFGVRCIRN